MVFGLILSIALMGVAATYIAKLLHRFAWIGYIGLVVVLYVALHMIWDGYRATVTRTLNLAQHNAAVPAFLQIKPDEVQKYCSLTNHVWAGFHVAFNVGAWTKLPPDLQEMVHRVFSAEALEERKTFVTMTENERVNLAAKGLTFNAPDNKPFREALAKSGYYVDIKKTAGDEAWALLEKYVGPLS